MFKHPRARRTLSVVLIIAGGILIFLAPENAWIGTVLALLGIIIELIAIALGHNRKNR
ncbi:MAG TPA: hypothetical protein VHK70_01350 [Burkholderiaceae bacterium]|jgi:Na+/phosphate symporter|nr:hypothetical protein [Burkholderiaceae bacterium]